jgi:hypothetical protein
MNMQPGITDNFDAVTYPDLNTLDSGGGGSVFLLLNHLISISGSFMTSSGLMMVVWRNSFAKPFFIKTKASYSCVGKFIDDGST